MRQMVGIDRNLFCFLNDHNNEAFGRGELRARAMAEVVIVCAEGEYGMAKREVDSATDEVTVSRRERLSEVRFWVNDQSIGMLIDILNGIRGEFKSLMGAESEGDPEAKS